jgi:hypothetical protein
MFNLQRFDNTNRGQLSPPFFIFLFLLFQGCFGGDSWSTGDPAGVGADCPHSLQARDAHKTPAVDTQKIGTRSLDLTGSPVVLYGSQPPPDTNGTTLSGIRS